MNPYTASVCSCVVLFLLMPAVAIAGHRIRRRTLHRRPDSRDLDAGSVNAAVLSLLGLLTAFTFHNAYSRFDTRRSLIVDEVNAVGTAYLRVDLLPADSQPAMRLKFREYVESRNSLWQLSVDIDAAIREQARSESLQLGIWNAAVEATRNESSGDARKLLLPALNDMIDITTVRLVAVQSHPPLIIFLMLGVLSMAAAGITGFEMAKYERPSYIHIFGLSALASLAVYLILDIEFPRFGFVTLESVQQLFVKLRDSM